MGTDERAIREVHSTWIDAVNAGELVRLLTMMADDAVFLSPGRAPFGRDGFSEGFSAAHKQLRINCISELEEVVVVGEVAYTRSRDSLSVVPRTVSTRSGQAAKEAGGPAEGKETQLAGYPNPVKRTQPDRHSPLPTHAH